MFQLIYTSCRPGASLDGSGGYTVRAATLKTDPSWIAFAPRLARYEASGSINGTATPRLDCHRRDNATIISHSVGIRDHQSRPASFTHAVIDDSGTLTPKAAIEMWGSPFWQRADNGGPTALPALDSLGPTGELDWVSLGQCLGQESFRRMTEFLLTAWLGRKNQSIILLADAQQVAGAIWLLAHCLPAGVLKGLSFATQDHDPATAGAAVVGYDSMNRRLPPAALAGHYWFDARSGQCSDPAVEAYAHFACKEVLAGHWSDLEKFVAVCEAVAVQSLDQLDLLHRFCHQSHICTEKELLRLHDQPRLLRWLLRDPRHVPVAIATVISSGSSSAAMQPSFAQRNVLAVLLSIAAEPNAIAATVFPRKPAIVLQMMANDSAFRSRIDLDVVMDEVKDAGQLKLDILASPEYASFWPVLLRGRYRDLLAIAIAHAPISQQTGSVFADSLRSTFAKMVLFGPATEALQQRLEVLECLNTPAAPIARPQNVVAAVAELPPPDRRAILALLAPRLAVSIACADVATLAPALSALLELIVSETPWTAGSVLRQFAKAVLDNGRLLSDVSIATMTAAHAFGALGRAPDGADDRDQLVDLGVELVQIFARAGGPAFNHDVTRQAMRWPERARDLFRLASRNQRVHGSIRAKLARLRVDLPEDEQ